MKVVVDYLGYIKGLIGVDKTEEFQLEEGSSVFDLLNMLAKKHGAPFKEVIYGSNASDLKENIILTVNGLLLNQLKGTETLLRDSDQISIMPIVSGG